MQWLVADRWRADRAGRVGSAFASEPGSTAVSLQNDSNLIIINSESANAQAGWAAPLRRSWARRR